MKLGSIRLAAAGVAVAAVSIFPAGALTATADDISVTKPYIIPAGDVQTSVPDCTGNGLGPGGVDMDWGGVCFTPVAGQKITVTIKDTLPVPTGASYLFNNSADTIQPIGLGNPQKFQAAGTFCGTLKDFTVPAGSNQLWIAIGIINQDQAAPFNQDTSIGCGTPSPGSTGTVTASGPGALKAPAPAPVALPFVSQGSASRAATIVPAWATSPAATNHVLGRARLI